MGAETIESVSVGGSEFVARWGSCGCDYYMGGTRYDFQDLMVKVSEQRAAGIELEVAPMEIRMTDRNEDIETLGVTLSALTKATDTVDTSQEKVSDQNGTFTVDDTVREGLRLAGLDNYANSYSKNQSYTVNKADIDYMTEMVKTATDKLNNDSSSDSTRLQSLVDSRDNAYSTATTMMTNISDTRSTLIKSL